MLRFFSRKDWDIGSQSLPASLAPLVPDRQRALASARGQEVGEGPEDEGPAPFSD